MKKWGNLRELTESIKAVFEPEISRKKLSCDYLVKVTEEFVSYDETKVREILLNIIGNSVKYTPDGGNISVRVEQISKGDQGSASYRFTVADTGIGMSEEYLPHIFEEFTRERTSTETRVEGTGLGLPIVKSLVDMMGGSIDVQSKVGSWNYHNNRADVCGGNQHRSAHEHGSELGEHSGQALRHEDSDGGGQ